MWRNSVAAALIPAAVALCPGWAAAGDATAQPVAAAARPTLAVEKQTLDLGKVQAGTDAVGTFKLKNSGNAELKILSAKPG